MKVIKTTVIAIFLFAMLSDVYAQDDYIVKTTTQKSYSGNEKEEEVFVVDNFPYYMNCDWKPGQKFMLVLEERYGFMPVMKEFENGREVSNNKLQYKVFEFQGIEEVEKETYTGKVSSTRLIFEGEGKKYYHELKNKNIREVCMSNPRTFVSNLLFLDDVDIARKTLVGKTLYTKVTSARVDDANSSGGYRDVSIPRNLEVTVKAVGAGVRESPVKVIFEDKDGNSYYRNLTFSRTNSGMLDVDMTGNNLEKYFPNVFSFTDQEVKSNEDVRKKYVGRSLYPKRTIEVTKAGNLGALVRYTPLYLKDMKFGPGTRATLLLVDKGGIEYATDINLKYDVFVKNDDYIDDVFGYGDLSKKYPAISKESWALIANGEVKIGMTKEECKLALGPAAQIRTNVNSRYETWFYPGKILDFDGNNLLRIK